MGALRIYTHLMCVRNVTGGDGVGEKSAIVLLMTFLDAVLSGLYPLAGGFQFGAQRGMTASNDDAILTHSTFR